MYRRESYRAQGGAVGRHHVRWRAAAGGLPSVAKGLAVLGCAAVPLVPTTGALAQGTLPPISVEATTPKVKKKKAAAPKAAPVQPAGPAEPGAARDKARSEAVYTAPAAVSDVAY